MASEQNSTQSEGAEKDENPPTGEGRQRVLREPLFRLSSTVISERRRSRFLSMETNCSRASETLSRILSRVFSGTGGGFNLAMLGKVY